MLFCKNNSRRKSPKILFRTWLNLLTLSLLCKLVHGFIEDLAPVIPLNGNEEHYERCPQICHSEICGDEALRLVKLIDEQVDPCTNFYQFACGNFLKNAQLDDGVMDKASEELSKITKGQISSDIQDTDLEALKKAKIYYQNCMNEALSARAGSRPLLEVLNKIGGWPVLLGNRWDERGYNWMDTVYKINDQRYPEFYFPAAITVQPDNRDSSKNAIKIYSVSLNVNPNFFMDERSDEILNAYLNFMVQLAKTLGATDDAMTLREMRQVLDFEMKLYNATTPQEQLAEMFDEELNIAELSSRYPGIPWLEFINRILGSAQITVDEREKVYVKDPKFVSGVSQLIRTTPKRVIANYLAWRVAATSVGHMSKDLANLEKDYQSVLDGGQDLTTRSSMCTDETSTLFVLGTSAMYIRKHFDKSAASPIAEMFSNMKSALRKSLQQTDWMDEATRRAALEKCDEMNVTIGSSEELMDSQKIEDYYRDLEISPGLYLQSAFNVSYFMRNKNYKTLRYYSSKDKWTKKQSASEFNAYNIADENNVEIPAGLIQTFYNKVRPQYLNYGTVGTIVGHEIMHGFDNQGRNYDKRGNQVNWWQSDTAEKFQEKSRCLVEQYGNFTIQDINAKVNGELTKGENIADNGGFKIAYIAYNDWAKRNNVVEKCLPSLNYTPQQMFWIAAATAWCTKKTPESLRNSLTDEHSPADARVILTFSNLKEFARDFKCEIGSRMNPDKKCEMW